MPLTGFHAAGSTADLPTLAGSEQTARQAMAPANTAKSRALSGDVQGRSGTKGNRGKSRKLLAASHASPPQRASRAPTTPEGAEWAPVGPVEVLLTPVRASWPRCGARCRTTGRGCRAEGSGISGRCRMHCGATLAAGWGSPPPTWTVTLAANGCWIHPSRGARGRWPAEVARLAAKWPQRIREWVAVRLVERGAIAHGIVYRNRGAGFLRAVARRGVMVLADRGDTVVRRLRFEVGPPRVSRSRATLWARRRSHG